MEVIGLVVTSKILIKMGDTGYFGTFEVEREILTRKFMNEPVQQEMIGAFLAAAGHGGGLEEV